MMNIAFPDWVLPFNNAQTHTRAHTYTLYIQIYTHIYTIHTYIHCTHNIYTHTIYTRMRTHTDIYVYICTHTHTHTHVHISSPVSFDSLITLFFLVTNKSHLVAIRLLFVVVYFGFSPIFSFRGVYPFIYCEHTLQIRIPRAPRLHFSWCPTGGHTSLFCTVRTGLTSGGKTL